MARDFTEALKTEIAQLEAALAVDVRFRRLNELRRVLKLYSDDDNTQVTQVPQGPTGPTAGVERVRIRRRVSPERKAAMDATIELLRGKTEPTPTRDIMAYLDSRGIAISGDVPLNNLSAMLSNTPEVVSNGRSGWTLRSVGDEVSDEIVRSVCEIALADMETADLQSLYLELKRKPVIPPEFDGRLLGMVRERAGRDLSEHEKRRLREVFRQTVRDSLPPNNADDLDELF